VLSRRSTNVSNTIALELLGSTLDELGGTLEDELTIGLSTELELTTTATDELETPSEEESKTLPSEEEGKTLGLLELETTSGQRLLAKPFIAMQVLAGKGPVKHSPATIQCS